jgi:hypothetical protein
MNTTSSQFGFWKTAAVYGGLAGFIIILTMVTGFATFGLDSWAGSQIFGFLLMFFVLSLVFFGMKQFRDFDQGGVMRFSQGLLLGIAMSVFAGTAYVIVWEMYLAATDYAFIIQYTEQLIAQQKSKGISAEALSNFIAEMDVMKDNYAQPSFRLPLTFLEIFPMGFIVTLISATTLHNPKLWARKD